MNDVFKTFLEWVERVLPGLLVALGLGYKVGKAEKEKIQIELEEAKLRLKLRENELNNEKEFSGLSDDDVIDKFIGRKPTE